MLILRGRLIAAFSLVAFSALRGAEVPSPSGANAPASALPDSEPSIKSWAAPGFPPSLPPTVRTGSAVARIIVDDKGAITAARVLKASDPAFGDAAVAAVKQWRFSPGVDHGKYATMCLDVPFEFDRAKDSKAGALPMGSLQMAPQTKPALQDAPLGDFPASLTGRGLSGQVIFGCVVNADGSASDLRVLQTSHPDFVLPAIESSRNWKFVPAKQGDLTVPAVLRGEVFYVDVQPPARDQVLAANGITAPDGSQPQASPQLLTMTDPIWPIDALLAGKSGSANVEFTVTGNGSLRDIHVRDASDPAFGAAVVAAVSTWTFEPAMVHGMGTDVTLVKHADFKAVGTDPAAASTDALTRLVNLARAHAIGGGRGLDERLTPIYRIAPVTPEGLDGQKGEAKIEFVIDRDGRARLPRIISATNDAFGWAAATAVSQWIFKAPKRGGQPTEVKVQIPIAF